MKEKAVNNMISLSSDRTMTLIATIFTATSLITLPACAGDNASRRQKFEQRFQAADENADGVLTEAEAEAGMPRLSDKFTTIDADNSGTISLDEIARAIAARRNR